MAVTLQDPIQQRDPSSRHAFREVGGEAPLRAVRTLAEELIAGFHATAQRPETTFEVASHGGYARTVTGTVTFLDEEAQTFMVRVPDGREVRVPLRDVTAARVHPDSNAREPRDPRASLVDASPSEQER
jgi:hypothetical protein